MHIPQHQTLCLMHSFCGHHRHHQLPVITQHSNIVGEMNMNKLFTKQKIVCYCFYALTNSKMRVLCSFCVAMRATAGDTRHIITTSAPQRLLEIQTTIQ